MTTRQAAWLSLTPYPTPLTIEAFTGETDNNGTTDSTFKFKENGYGVTYTITPGLSLSVTNNTWDQDGTTDEDGKNTAVALDLSF